MPTRPNAAGAVITGLSAATPRASARIAPSILAAALLCALHAPAALGDGHAAIDRAGANAIVAAPGRTEADRKRDARRHPDELLVFARIEPGMHAADIGAGDGYTTELLARAVGPEGKVYGHNSPYVIEKYVSESWPARLARPVNANVVRVDAPVAEPLPSGTTGLDVVTMIFTYHDTYLTRLGEFDHRGYLRRFHAMMKPGGCIIVVDHRAKVGARGPEVADDLHRIDEARVKEDFEAAGFVLDGTADFMANAEDPHEQAFYQMDQPTDAFVHRWVKPKK